MNIIIVTLCSIVYLLVINRFKLNFCSATSESFSHSRSSSVSRSGTDSNYDLFTLELDNKRSNDKYTYERRANKNTDFYVTSQNHRIKAITKGGTTVWKAKNQEYPNRVLYKEDPTKPLLQVIYSDADQLSDSQPRKSADVKKTTHGAAYAEFSISSGDEDRKGGKTYADFDLPDSGEPHKPRAVVRRGHQPSHSPYSGNEKPSSREFSLPSTDEEGDSRAHSVRSGREISLPETDDEAQPRGRSGRAHQDFSLPESGEQFTVHHSNRPRAGRGHQDFSLPESGDDRHGRSGRGHQDFSLPESGDGRSVRSGREFSLPESGDDMPRGRAGRGHQEFSIPDSGDDYTVIHSNRQRSSGREYSLPETDDERHAPRGRRHQEFSVPETDDDMPRGRAGRGHQDYSIPDSGDDYVVSRGRRHQDYSIPESGDDRYARRGRGHQDFSLPESGDERFARRGRGHQEFSVPETDDDMPRGRARRGHQEFSLPESGDDYVVSRGARRAYRVETTTSPMSRGRPGDRHVDVSISSGHEAHPRTGRGPLDRRSVELSLPSSSDDRMARHVLDRPSHMPLHKSIPYGHVARPQRPPLQIPSAGSEAEEEEKDEEVAALERKVRELDNNLKLMRAALKLMQENEELRKQLESTSYIREPYRTKRTLHPPSTLGGPEYLKLYTENYDGTLAENDRSQYSKIQHTRDFVTYTFHRDAKCVKVRYKNKEWNYNPSDPNAKYPIKVVYNGKADMIKIEKGLTEYAVMIGINS